MSSSKEEVGAQPEKVSSDRGGREGHLARAAPARVSFTESLVGKLPVGSRFEITGPGTSAPAADDAASAATHDATRSTVSTIRGGPEGVAGPTTPQAAPGTSEAGPSTPEDALMASLHVKFSASTRFNASDAGSLPTGAGAEAMATGLPRTFQLQQQPSRGRRRSAGSSLLDPDQEGPMGGIMRVLSGRQRPVPIDPKSANLTAIPGQACQAISSGPITHFPFPSAHRRSRSADISSPRRSSAGSGRGGSPVGGSARTSRDGSEEGGRRGGRMPSSRRRRRPSPAPSSGNVSDGDGSRQGRWSLGLGATALWSLLAGGNGPLPGKGLQRSQSLPIGRYGQSGSARHRRSGSFGSPFAERMIWMEGVDSDGRASGSAHRSRSLQRGSSRRHSGDPGVEAEGGALHSPFRRRRSRSRSLSRSLSRGEPAQDAEHEQRRSGWERRRTRPQVPLFSTTGREQRGSLEGSEGSLHARRSHNPLPRSHSGGRPPEPSSGRQVGVGGVARAAGPRALEHTAGIFRWSRIFSSCRAAHSSAAAQPVREALGATAAVSAAGPPRASFATASRSGSIAPQASHAGSLPSLAFVPSPTIRQQGGPATPSRNLPPNPQQLQLQPSLLQRTPSPERRASPLQRLTPTPSLGRQQPGLQARGCFGVKYECVAGSGRGLRAETKGGGSGAVAAVETAGVMVSRGAARRGVGPSRPSAGRARKMSGISHADPWAEGAPASGQPSTGKQEGGAGGARTYRFMNWLLAVRRRLGGTETSSPERPTASQSQLSGEGASGASVTPPSASFIEHELPEAPSPAADVTSQRVAAAAAGTAAAAVPPPSASSPVLTKATSSRAQGPSMAFMDAAAARGSSPDPSTARPSPPLPSLDVRDSPLMQIRPSPRSSPPLDHLRPQDRVRPTPLKVSSDPRTPVLQASAPQGGGADVAAAAVVAVASAGGPATATAGAGRGKMPAAAAGGSGLTEGGTPEKARKGGLSQLAGLLGAMMRFRSPGKDTASKDRPSIATTAASPPPPPASNANAPVQGATREHPQPAFPPPRPPTTTDDGSTQDPPKSSTGPVSVMQSAFAGQGQVVFTDEDAAAADEGDGQHPKPSRRRSRHGRTKSDQPQRNMAPSRTRPATAGAAAIGAAGAVARSTGARPASAGAALGAASRSPGAVIISPTAVPVGRSVSPLGRSMAAASAGGAGGFSPGPAGGDPRTAPVIMIAPLADAIPGRALISPLRGARPGSSIVKVATAIARIGEPIGVANLDGPSIMLAHDRHPGFTSTLRPAPGQLAHPLLQPSGAELPFRGPQLPAPRHSGLHVDPIRFPAPAPAPLVRPALDADGLPLPGLAGAAGGQGAVLPGATFTRLMARAAIGDPRLEMQQRMKLLRVESFLPTSDTLNLQQQQRQREQLLGRDEATTAAAAAVGGAGAGAGGPMDACFTSPTQFTYLPGTGQVPSAPPGPGAYRRHRPLWLGHRPAEKMPTLQRPAQPALLQPEMPYGPAAAPPPSRSDTGPGFWAAGQAAPAAQHQQQQQQQPGSFLTGAGRSHAGDNSSSLASSSTANSLREIQPALALELRRRELLDPYGPYAASGPAGVSGVTVRGLKRTVTAGPHVKLLKPRQLLRNLQPPGPTPAFTRRQHVPPAEAHLEVLDEREDPPAASDGTAGGHAPQIHPSQFPTTAQQPTGSEQGSSTSAQAIPQQEPPPADAQQPVDGNGHRLPQPREAWSSSHQQQEWGGISAGWAPPPAVLLRPAEGSIAVPAVRTLTAAPLPGAGRSPPRLLRLPQGPADHQVTRNHTHSALPKGAEVDEPRYLNVRLMRVLEPRPKSPSDPLPGEAPAPGLPMRKLRALERPEGELPGITPAGTAGRTERLLGMLRRVEDRTRPVTGLYAGGPLGQRVGLFDGTAMPLMDANAASDAASMTAAASQCAPATEAATSAAPADPTSSQSCPPERPRQHPQHPQHPQQASVFPVAKSKTSPQSPGPSSPQQLLPPRGSTDMATQSALAQPTIDIHVHSTTTAITSTSAGTAPGATPPLPASVYGYPAAPLSPQRQHQQPCPQPDPQLCQVPVTAPADLGALAGLSALSQLTVLASLSQLGAAVGGLPGVEDPSLWPDLLETTPESLRQVSENTVARWRQQRAALAQPDMAALRDMDPALQLEPTQMLGPGPLGEAQHALRHGRSQGGGGGGGGGAGPMPGGPYPGGPGDVPRDDSPGKWLVSRSVDGTVLAISPTAKAEQEGGHGGELGSAARERRRRERERGQRRRRQSGPGEAGFRGKEGGGESEGRRQKGDKEENRKKGLQRRAGGSGRHRKRASSSGGDAISDSGNSEYRSGRSTSSSSSTSSSEGSDGSRGGARHGASAPGATAAGAPENGDNDGGAGPPAPPATRPEPGDDFGLDVAERLLHRMAGSEMRSSRRGSRSDAMAADRLQQQHRPPPAVAATGSGGTDSGEPLAGKEAPGGVGVVTGLEDAGLAASRGLSPAVLGHGPTDPRHGSSPHAKMVDVLRGPETNRRAQEILDRHSALRAKYLAAADNLRAAVLASSTAGQQGTPPATQDVGNAGGGGGTSPGSQGSRLGPEPTRSRVAALATASAPTAQPGAPGGSLPVASAGSAPQVATTDPQQGQQGQQAINIYCTQLVLNPGRGPITVPGLPAYYPAPGPAAWAGVPVAVPSSPPAYPGPHYVHPGPTSPSGADLREQRPVYVCPSSQAALRPHPPAVKVLHTGAAVWVPPNGGAELRAADDGRGAAAAASTAVGNAKDRLGAVVTENEMPSLGASPHPGRSSSSGGGGGGGPLSDAPTVSGNRVTPGKRLVRRVIGSKRISHDTSGGIVVLSREGDGGRRPSDPTSSNRSSFATVAAEEEEGEAEVGEGRDQVEEQQGKRGETALQALPRGPSGGVVSQGSAADGEVLSLTGSKPGSLSGSGSNREGGESEAHVRGAGREAGDASRVAEDSSGFGEQLSAPPPEQQQVMPPPPPPPPPAPPRQVALAAELTQLILEAFQQSGGVILPEGTEAPTGPPPPGASGGDDGVTYTGRGPAGPAYLTDAFGGTVNSTAAGPSQRPTHPSALSQSTFLPSTLPNTAVPRGKGPTFLQVRDIEMEGLSGGRDGAGMAALAAGFQGGMADWEAQPIAVLRGRQPGGPAPPAAMGPGGGGEPQTQVQGPGMRSPGRGLTAAEVLALKPNPEQQRRLAALQRLRARQEAAVAERRARYQAGLQHFADPTKQLRPLFLPLPEYQMPAGAGAGGGDGGFGVGAGGEGPWYASGSRNVALGRRRSLFSGDETRGSVFPVPVRQAYLTRSSLEQQPRTRSPRQQRMHAEVKRRRWSSRREDAAVLPPQVAAMIQHQHNFTNRVRSAMHPSADAAGCEWGFGADHGEGDQGEDWDDDGDPLGPETECGGCNFPGCPVHGSGVERGGETPTVHTGTRVARRSAQPLRAAGKRPAVAGSSADGVIGSRAVEGEERTAEAAGQGRGEEDAEDAEEARQRVQREMHRAALLDRWTAEMRTLGAASARVEATQKVAVASVQQALAARRERQAAELADMFRLLGEVDELASTLEQQTSDTKKMMQVLEEEAELRRVSRLNSLLLEARRLGGQPRALATSSTERVYVNFHIYKTRAAMAVRLLPPSFTTENGYKTLERDGVMLLEFANANPGQPSGTAPAAGGINRTYNWSNKISFALSPSELGTMLAGDAIASDKGLVMYHDPTKLGKVGEPMKRLTMKQMPDGAISFSLSAAPDNISLPVSRGEFEVLKSLAHYAIPRLLGFDAAFQ
ncbi:hypothetical protein VOLCADRAFT_86539 [Volvox carteri f. nagariensis]|uniref:Uncharacterized protein n=1 Tax=Volvox carteri f. nagariensis TaxID=3068 RepID=D8TIY3_VOLCA|nr:uncharacterized protein VOLCADRAFT_86539 [Volvox carteri f. nagariensis]EFJ52446.1 hypothetical protein VOLCADRAFT_86539 [Volvox carteri f. nagariensis]|eukprot:XP_002946519.1 hypothetical protein VOLCADRAFT_86539 [Volvox carteri f. nagariensis]